MRIRVFNESKKGFVMKKVTKELTKSVSKGQLKARLYEYCKALEEDGGMLLVTDYGRPVLQITALPHKEKETAVKASSAKRAAARA